MSSVPAPRRTPSARPSTVKTPSTESTPAERPYPAPPRMLSVAAIQEVASHGQPLPSITTTSCPPAAGSVTNSRALRLNNTLREKFDIGKRLSQGMKKTPLCDISHGILEEWSSKMWSLFVECDELVATLPSRIAEMDVSSPNGAARRQSTLSPSTAGRSMIGRPLMGVSLHAEGSGGTPSVAGLQPHRPSAVRSPLSSSLGASKLAAPANPTSSGAALTVASNPVAQAPTVSSKAIGGIVLAGSGPGAVVSALIPDRGSLTQILHPAQDLLTDKMRALSLSVQVCLDASTRALNAEKAAICMPVRGVREDLRSVISVGFEKEDHHTHRPSATSAEVLCMRSGMMIVCSNGMNPPVELDMRSALAFFQKEAAGGEGEAVTPLEGILHDAYDDSRSNSEHPSTVPNAAVAMLAGSTPTGIVSRQQRLGQPVDLASSQTFRGIPSSLGGTWNGAPSSHPGTSHSKGGLSSATTTAALKQLNHSSNGTRPPILPSTVVTSLRSRYWSKLVCPIRLHNAAPVMGVVTFLNKDQGNSNFSTDDETIAFGAAATLAGMLARCQDPELLSRCYQRVMPVPPFPPVLQASVTVPGSRSQLVYRTKDPNGGRDIRILLTDGRAERLDAHTSLLSVSDYIQRMQQSWRDAVLLNAELRRTHEDRTRVVTSLLVRARTSELKNTVLQQERVDQIPDDDSHNEQFYRDYTQFKKHKKRLEKLADEEREAQQQEREREQHELRQLQRQRQAKYSRSISQAPQEQLGGFNNFLATAHGGSNDGESGAETPATGQLQVDLSQLYGVNDDEDEDDVYAKDTGGEIPTSHDRRESDASQLEASPSLIRQQSTMSPEHLLTDPPSHDAGSPQASAAPSPPGLVVEYVYDGLPPDQLPPPAIQCEAAPSPPPEVSSLAPTSSSGTFASFTHTLSVPVGATQLSPAVSSPASRRGSGSSTPQNVLASPCDEADAVDAMMRQRRNSNRAKELLFGKQPLPPHVL